jgi:hypothetical protein
MGTEGKTLPVRTAAPAADIRARAATLGAMTVRRAWRPRNAACSVTTAPRRAVASRRAAAPRHLACSSSAAPTRAAAVRHTVRPGRCCSLRHRIPVSQDTRVQNACR